MSKLNWGMIQDGGVFESLMHAILLLEEPGTILFGRPGKDAGQDARSADGTVVYQAKFRQELTMDGVVSLTLEELTKIKRTESRAIQITSIGRMLTDGFLSAISLSTQTMMQSGETMLYLPFSRKNSQPNTGVLNDLSINWSLMPIFVTDSLAERTAC